MTCQRISRTLFLVALILTVSVSGAARAIAAEIPAVGDKAPEFKLTDLAGDEVSLAKLRADGPVVLVVLRGYPGYQCPICSFQMAGLVKQAQEIKAKGAKVVMVYPGPAEELDDRAREFTKSTKLPEGFSFVTDPDYGFTNAYGLRWEAPRETAYPSTFVIAQDGTVRYAKVSKTHAGRASAAEVLDALAEAK